MNVKSAVSAILLTLTIVLVGAAMPLSEEAAGQETAGPMELNLMNLFFTEGMELSPLEPETSDEYQAVAIPNGFIRDGFRGFNLLPVGHTYWKAVGTWYTQPLKKQINLGGKAEISIYAYKEESGDSGSPVSDFRFELLRGNEPLLDLYIGSIRISEGQDTRITVTGSFPPGNDTTIEPGVSLSLRITARCNGGGAVLKFGSKTYPSGFNFGSNALMIHTIGMTKNHVLLEYKDAFMVPWTKLHTQLMIDRVIIPNEEMTSMMNPVNMTRELHWERNNKPGDYEVFVSIGYSPEQNISQQAFLKITETKQDWWKLDNLGRLVQNNVLVVILLILVFVSLLMYSRHRKTVWQRRFGNMPPELRRKDDKQKKDAWKEMDKKRRERWKEEREKRIIRDEDDADEEEDEDFRIFKRKVKKEKDIRMEDLLDEEGESMDLEL